MKNKVITIVPSKELSSLCIDHLIGKKLIVEDIIHNKTGEVIGCFCKSAEGEIRGVNGWFIPIDSVFEVTLINQQTNHS